MVNEKRILALATLLLPGSIAALEPSHSVTQYAHAAWTQQTGSVPGSVLAVTQTSDGTLWIGTEFGLLRFDGVTFSPWLPPSGSRLPRDFVQVLAPARDGSLWIGTRGGLSHWNGEKLENYHTSNDPAGPSVAALLVDHAGEVWAGAAGFRSGALCRVEASQLDCDSRGGFPGREVLTLLEDRRGHLWVGGADGLYRWKAGAMRVYELTHSAGPVSSIVEGRNGELLAAVGNENELERVADGKLLTYPVRSGSEKIQMRTLLSDRNGALWVGTNGQGLVHFFEGRIDRYTRADGLSGDTVVQLFEDREGSIWAATDRGVDRFRDFPVATVSKREGLSEDTVGSVSAAQDGGVWIGTAGGLDRVQNNRIILYNQRQGLPSDSITALFEDRAGALWADTNAGLAYLLGGSFQPLNLPAGRKVRSVAAAAEERDGTLWFSDFEHGMIRVQDGTAAEAVPWSQFQDRQASALEADLNRGGLWMGFSQGGVAYFAKGHVAHWRTASDGLGRGMVTDLHLERNGALWIATEAGLSQLRDGRIVTLTAANGLPCDRIHAMVEDDDGALWLNTACGLARIAGSDLAGWAANPRSKVRVKLFGAEDGMRVRTTVSGTFRRAAKSKDGRLWFPVLNGVAVVDPRHLPENRLPPPVQIERVTADHQTYAAKPRLKLPPLTKDLEIDYTAFSFVAPERVRFRYRLDGFDRNWNDVNGRRQARYTNLPPGRYRFQVIACNNDGVWNEAGASLDFAIQPEFYQANWFRLLSAAALGLLLWTLYRLRMRQLAAELNVRFEERLSERTRIARELHDTLLQNIAGFALHLDGLSKIVTGPLAAKDRLRELRREAERWLHETRESVWDLRSRVPEGRDLVEALRKLGYQITSETPVRFRVTVSGTPGAAPAKFKEHLLRIVQEAVRNAVRHGRAQEIEVHLACADPGWIRVRISDDGCGFDLEEASCKAGHWGLATMRERAQKIGADLRITTAPGQGAEIEIVVPTPASRQ